MGERLAVATAAGRAEATTVAKVPARTPKELAQPSRNQPNQFNQALAGDSRRLFRV